MESTGKIFKNREIDKSFERTRNDWRKTRRNEGEEYTIVTKTKSNNKRNKQLWKTTNSKCKWPGFSLLMITII